MPDAQTSDPRDNTVTWWEIQVTDLDAAKTFYGTVFGWTYTEFGEGFAICHAADGRMVGGLEAGTGDPAGRHVHVYVQVADLESTLDLVTAAGGQVMRPRAVISDEFGWYAVFHDPSGIAIGLVTDQPARSSA